MKLYIILCSFIVMGVLNASEYRYQVHSTEKVKGQKLNNSKDKTVNKTHVRRGYYNFKPEEESVIEERRKRGGPPD